MVRCVVSRLDDVAIFAGQLTADELAARWNQSLTTRLLANEEPKLVLFWNFNDPLAVGTTNPRRLRPCAKATA